MSNNAEKSLLSIQEQINKFDNKANSLITIVGIVFALSLGILDTFNQFVGIELTEELQYKFRLLILFSTLYFISFTVELVFLILVVYPRKKKEGQPSLTYYTDVAGLSKEQIRELLQESEENSLATTIDQISINAKICKQKHRFLVIAIWSLIPLFAFMFSVFFTAIL